MVPVFEPEIENQIDRTLSRLAKKIDGRTEEAEKDRAKRTLRPAQRSTKRSLLPVWIVTGVVVIVLGAIAVSVIYKSADDYIRMARTSLSEGRPAQAAEYLESALEKRPQDAEAILLMARALRETGEPDAAKEMLMRIINSALFETDDQREAYRLYGEICRDVAAYGELRSLVERCPYEDIASAFAAYIPGTVTVLPEGGAHEAPFTVTIEASGTESVYYTLNGAEPDETSLPYSVPFTIEEEGTWLLQAVCINDAGVKSSVVSVQFEVEEGLPPEPQVLEESGEYTVETRIVVVAEEGLRILYETGKDAEVTLTSEEYTNPLQMPIGDSFFHFVCVDDEGRMSEVVSREYHFEPERAISTAQAVQHVQSELVRIGIIDNASGKKRDGTGTLSFVVDGTVTIGNDGEFYYIREYLTPEGGATEPTGLLYAVNTQTGMARRLGYDSYGEMMLMQFR